MLIGPAAEFGGVGESMKINPVPPVHPTGSTLLKGPFGADPLNCVKFWF
jgi:hypothetical protein